MTNKSFPSGLSVTRAKKKAKSFSKEWEIPLHKAQDKIAMEHIGVPWHKAIELLNKPPSNCLDCPLHQVLPDPDPDDWFNDDDCASVCTRTKNELQDNMAKWFIRRSDFRPITVSARPYQVRKESESPDWCPLKDKE